MTINENLDHEMQYISAIKMNENLSSIGKYLDSNRLTELPSGSKGTLATCTPNGKKTPPIDMSFGKLSNENEFSAVKNSPE